LCDVLNFKMLHSARNYGDETNDKILYPPNMLNLGYSNIVYCIISILINVSNKNLNNSLIPENLTNAKYFRRTN
jgi:hypothetical protein